MGRRHNCVSCTQRESKFMPRRGKSLMACHRRRGLRIVRGDDSFQNHRLSLTSSLLLPKPDPLSLGSGFVLFLAVTEVLRQHRTILVRRLRSQNLRQIGQKPQAILSVLPRIFGRYDGTLCKQDACHELCGVALTPCSRRGNRAPVCFGIPRSRPAVPHR